MNPPSPTDAPVQLSREQFNRLIDVCRRASAGDLEARFTGANGELAPLADAINAAFDATDSIVREASAAMAHCSEGKFHRPILFRGLPGAFAQCARIINRAGIAMRESSKQIDLVARLAEQNARNTQTVAAACEELTVTSTEISRQVNEVSHRSDQAVRQVALAREAVQALGLAAGKIDHIVSLINQVAGQTNMLALNATIEAARAGEHGRGFAVVATEVKDLSRNTRQATGDISREVSAMQQKVKEVSNLITEVSESMRGIATGAGGINGAVGEQVKATGEISRSISAVSENSRQVSEGMVRSRAKEAVAA